MRSSVQAVHRLVTALEPWDELEARHQVDTLSWLERTDDVFRRIEPGTPDPHLVSYVVMVDPDDGSVLLVDHVSAGLWLPPGGHVEVDEHPADAARRGPSRLPRRVATAAHRGERFAAAGLLDARDRAVRHPPCPPG